MVPAASGRVPRAPPYSGFRPVPSGCAYGAVTRYGPPFQAVPLPVGSLSAALLPRRRLNAPGLGSSPFARHYSGNHCCFLLLRLLRCFSSAGLPPVAGVPRLPRGGLPHSDTRGSPAICASPRLFAACHVLLRLQKPRHPPCALAHFPGASPGFRPRPRQSYPVLSLN